MSSQELKYTAFEYCLYLSTNCPFTIEITLILGLPFSQRPGIIVRAQVAWVRGWLTGTLYNFSHSMWLLTNSLWQENFTRASIGYQRDPSQTD